MPIISGVPDIRNGRGTNKSLPFPSCVGKGGANLISVSSFLYRQSLTRSNIFLDLTTEKFLYKISNSLLRTSDRYKFFLYFCIVLCTFLSASLSHHDLITLYYSIFVQSCNLSNSHKTSTRTNKVNNYNSRSTTCNIITLQERDTMYSNTPVELTFHCSITYSKHFRFLLDAL